MWPVRHFCLIWLLYFQSFNYCQLKEITFGSNRLSSNLPTSHSQLISRSHQNQRLQKIITEPHGKKKTVLSRYLRTLALGLWRRILSWSYRPNSRKSGKEFLEKYMQRFKYLNSSVSSDKVSHPLSRTQSLPAYSCCKLPCNIDI